ncbi:hypothetical protein [Mesorhizobium sp. KR1-2]|uniref:hypothetical protein n=1 Tax=Mesorhizobium sp. KR1-2 TaxID=3156609 RepID=UPI0032B58D7B
MLERLATDAWLDDPNTGGSATEERRIAFFQTQFDAGSRVIAPWYPWSVRPDDVSSAARELVEADARQMNRALIEEEIGRENAMIRFMLRCLRRATTLVLTAHEMSVEICRHGRMTRSHQAVLAGAAADRPTLYEAVRAARDGDFNPSVLFPSLLSYHDMLELARLVGRRSCGHDVWLDGGLVKEMKRVIAIRDEFDACFCVSPRRSRSMSRELRWSSRRRPSNCIRKPAIGGAIAAGSAITVTGRAGSAAA